MTERAIIDFDRLMERLGVGFRSKMSHGEMVNLPDWKTEHCLAALEIVRREATGVPVELIKHPARWIYCTIVYELHPQGVFVRGHDGSVSAVSMPIIAPDSPLSFRIHENDDSLFISYSIPGASDAERDFRYNFENLASLRIPELPEGKHIYLQTWGSSAVPVGMCLAYAPGAKSFWVAEPDEDVFHCAISNCPDYKIGDEITERKE